MRALLLLVTTAALLGCTDARSARSNGQPEECADFSCYAVHQYSTEYVAWSSSS